MGTTICIGGLIAAGKTTLIGKLSDHCLNQGLTCKVMLEMFPESVRQMVKINLPVEDSFMFAHRLQMALDAPDLARLYDLVLMERSFIDHLAFIEAFVACGRLEPYLLEWANKVVGEVGPPKPERYLYLEISPKLACKRREMRGSSVKGVFNLEFMTALQKAYDRLIPIYYEAPIRLNWEDFGEGVALEDLLERLLAPVKH